MAQSILKSTVSTFVRGLITEASPLTFPENASVDELNCSLARTGVRSRRKGIEPESGNVLSSFTFTRGTMVHTQTWENVANEAGVEFLVVQVGSNLFFYDKSSDPISANLKSFSVNLNSFSAGNAKTTNESRISAESVNGNLVVVSAAIDPFYIEFNPTTETITSTRITPRIRDFEWQGDTATYNKDISTGSVSQARKYDTVNSGWISAQASGGGVLNTYKSNQGKYPALTHSWFSGKTSSGNFSVSEWQRVFGGNTLLGNGHFILDLFNKDRQQAMIDDPLSSETAVLPIEIETERFTTVTGYAGRAWMAGINSKKNGSRVFFSRVVENPRDLGNFFQEADPTSEDVPDLVDSDGGVINIPEAHNIKKLFTWGSALIVLAENGAWIISGADQIFKATGFFVSRMPGVGGIITPDTFIDAEGTPVWWGKDGIFTVAGDTDPAVATPTGQDLTKETIQTFWDNIPVNQRLRAVGAYDERNKRIFWLYGNDDTIDFKYNKVLVLDLVLQAFYPWEFSDQASNTNYCVGIFYSSGLGTVDEVLDVVANSGTDDVVANSGVDDVVATIAGLSGGGTAEIKFLYRDGSSGKLSVATLSNTEFLDWGSVNFLSFAEAGYDFEEDATTRKHGLYVTTYLNLTETGFTGNETTGYSFVNPSSCIMKAFWDLRTSASSSQQIYRHLLPIVVDPGNLNSFNYPQDTIITRNRIQGRGRVLKLRFESEQGKDFQLQGYEVINAKNNQL